jgi:hypothetical protein
MAVEDLASALKNAVDRGQNLERAATSLVNAGYDPQEVTAAVQMVAKMASSQPAKVSLNPLQTSTPVQLTQRPQIQQQNNFAKLPRTGFKQKVKGKGLVIASIVVVSLLILLLIGILFAILFG